MSVASRILAYVGAVAIGASVIKAAYAVRVYLIASKLDRYAHVSADGRPPWALVTGSSDGIGVALAQELATRGFNVVLHGRDQAKLEGVKSQLQSGHPNRSFRTLIADASLVSCVNCLRAGEQQSHLHPSQAPLDFTAIKDALSDLHLTVLINNAGAGPSNPVYRPLGESSEQRITSNVSLNALFPLHLIRVLLPHLAQNAPALVVNISSMADDGFPLIVSYGASKQFLMTVTRAVRLELALLGQADVECLGIRVANVTGVSHNKKAPSLFLPDTETMARAALDRAGHGHGVITGYWAHALQMVGLKFMPTMIVDKMMIDVIRGLRDVELKSA